MKNAKNLLKVYTTCCKLNTYICIVMQVLLVGGGLHAVKGSPMYPGSQVQTGL